MNRWAALLLVLLAAVLLAVHALGDLVLGRSAGQRGIEPIEVADALGATVEPDPRSDGLIVTSVRESGPATKAGIRVGDIIEGIGRTRVHSLRDAAIAIDQSAGSVSLAMNRRQHSANVRLLLASHPAENRDAN